MSLTVWDLSLTRDNGGERWKWPRIEWPKRYRHAFSTRVGMRVGWRMTAWGLHVGRTFISDGQYPDVAAEAKATAAICDRTFESTTPVGRQSSSATSHHGRRTMPCSLPGFRTPRTPTSTPR